MDAKFEDVGAAWEKEKNGEIRFNITLKKEVSGKLFMFKNKYKKEEKQPDWKILRYIGQ